MKTTLPDSRSRIWDYLLPPKVLGLLAVFLSMVYLALSGTPTFAAVVRGSQWPPTLIVVAEAATGPSSEIVSSDDDDVPLSRTTDQLISGAALGIGYLDYDEIPDNAERSILATIVRRAFSVAPNNAVTPLYRAVSPAELADLKAAGGAFRNPAGIEVKYFSETAEGAASYAQQAHRAGGAVYEGPYTIVRTEVPSNAITPIMRAAPDRGIPTVTLPTEVLPRLAPGQPLPHSPIPGAR